MLRGINLGKRQLKSAELKAVVESLGFADVKTLLASGNVVFTADETDPAVLERTLHDALAKVTGLKSEIFVRSPAEMNAVAAADPFPEATAERPSFVVVSFHRAPVDQAAVARLAESHDGPERMHAVGRELYIDFPDGQGRSTLHPAMTKAKLDPVNTARNWNTVLKIRDAL
jgi:uncharacterized protein (DUF1697 family)